MSNQIMTAFYGDMEVRYDANGFLSLTDMWAASGKPSGKLDPRQWARKPKATKSGASGRVSEVAGPGREFIEFMAKKLNVPIEQVYKTSRGRGGGTWAHWQIAIDYARYLSPEFHAWTNQVVREGIEEYASPELGVKRSRERAIESWRARGKSEAFIRARLAEIDVRNDFTDALGNHGVEGIGFGICTNNIYTQVLGGKAAKVKQERGLLQKGNLREHMSVIELAGTMFAEVLAADKIERENLNGLGHCATACLDAGMNVRESINKHEESIKSLPHETSQSKGRRR